MYKDDFHIRILYIVLLLVSLYIFKQVILLSNDIRNIYTADIIVDIYKYSGEFSAYTLSVDETDGNPCIGSRNTDLCKLKPILELSEISICASRDLELDTLIDIQGIGKCLIVDRMNLRYKGTGNIDILMDTKQEANNFGRKILKYKILN